MRADESRRRADDFRRRMERVRQRRTEASDLVEALVADVAEVAAAARSVLGVDLRVEADRSRLVDNPDFSYQLGEPIGWSELITASLRRRLQGRRQAVADLLTEADRLTRQQVGRTRADLQVRLQDSARVLFTSVTHRFAAVTDLLESALAEAAWDRVATSGDATATVSALQPRAERLQNLHERLTRF